ncbi:hypothetical protein FVEN_g9477 [Fusarium venenatum]|nr:hypothetical protein FVEN_g9477 [Fusarium venenatum]
MNNPEEPEATQSKIVILPRDGLVELRDVQDDWTGVTSWQERRKRQNRLSQRARRRRLKNPNDTSNSQVASLEDNNLEDQELGDGHLLLRSPAHIQIARNWQAHAYGHYLVRSPSPTLLQTLIRVNALNAIARNAQKIGIPVYALCRDEAVSPFSLPGPLPVVPTVAISPGMLRPTELQKTTVHHPWIDVLPLPRLRDNIIRALAIEWFDEDEICLEAFHPFDQCESEQKPALLIWGEADNIRGWEANIPFLRKWGWLLAGCDELFESTNAWRMQRGEKALNFVVH